MPKVVCVENGVVGEGHADGLCASAGEGGGRPMRREVSDVDRWWIFRNEDGFSGRVAGRRVRGRAMPRSGMRVT